MKTKTQSIFNIFLLVFSILCLIGGLITFGLFISDRNNTLDPLEDMYDLSKISFKEGNFISGKIKETGNAFATSDNEKSPAIYYIIPFLAEDGLNEKYIGICVKDPDKQEKITEIINCQNSYYNDGIKPENWPYLNFTGKILKMNDSELTLAKETLNISDNSLICPYVIVERKPFSLSICIPLLAFSIICLSIAILLILRSKKEAEYTADWEEYNSSPRRYTDYSSSNDLSGAGRGSSSSGRDMDSISNNKFN